MTVYLTRTARFSAAHRYYRPDWSEEQNRERFGACANPHGHGHNYVIEVMVSGLPDPETGFAVDLAQLDSAIDQRVVERLDHQHINHALPEFAEGRLIPSTENLAVWIWGELAGHLGDAKLVRVRVREDDQLWADFYGEAAGGGAGRRRGPIDV